MDLNYNSTNAPEPPIYHGWISKNGVCIPRRYQKPPLPPSMTVPPNRDIMETETSAEDENDEENVAAEEEDDIIKESDIDDENSDDELPDEDYDD